MQYLPNNYSTHIWNSKILKKIGLDSCVLDYNNPLIPKWFYGQTIGFFVISMVACWGVFGNIPNWDLVFISCLSVGIFFVSSENISKKLYYTNEKNFLKKVFFVGFFVRVVLVIYNYYYFNPTYYVNVYGDDADTGWYMDFAKDIAIWITGKSNYTFSQIVNFNNAAIDDVGYPFVLAIQYLITGGNSDVFFPFLVKSILGACCAIFIYRIAKRNFGIGTARIAALFVCFNPNMIYWCGTMMKETELVFFCCLALDNLDRVLHLENRLTLQALFPGILAGLLLFFMRSALGIVLFLAVFAHIVFASKKVISLVKKIVLGVLIFSALFIGVGDRILQQSKSYLNFIQSDMQQTNMEWRSERKGGNTLARYASATVFAPLIFTIPFPTFNEANAYQLTQMQLAGGSYIKNVLSFFVITVMLLLLLSGEWRKHVFILAYTCGYLVVLVFSGFAQSGRFHMPIWPMLMLFAAYGIQIGRYNKNIQNGYKQVLLLELLVCLAWNWFKLKGRGMI